MPPRGLVPEGRTDPLGLGEGQETVVFRLIHRLGLVDEHHRDGIPVMLVDEAEQVDDAEHDRLTALAAAEGIQPTFGD